jgi:hypothetical protein
MACKLIKFGEGAKEEAKSPNLTAGTAADCVRRVDSVAPP